MMSFAEAVVLKLKNDLKLNAKTMYGFEEKANMILEITSDEFFQITAYRKGLTGKKYYLSWVISLDQATTYLPLVKKIAFEKQDFKNNPLEHSIMSDGQMAITLQKNMLLHLIIKETGKLELITVGWVFKGIKEFLSRTEQLRKKKNL
jgi:hypothetical protein